MSRIVYMGSPDFAVPALERLNDEHEIIEVVSRPDTLDRRKRPKMQPVKKRALDLGLEVITPENINDPEVLSHLRELRPDLFVVAAYGQILGEELLGIPEYGSVNIHGSILPKYRGAAPVHRAIIEGEEETGVSLMLLDTGMDTGPVLGTRTVEITETTTSGELYDSATR